MRIPRARREHSRERPAIPILVRPHPEKQGHYQTAYGHRRLKAVRRLELQVKAIVRTLTDDELVLAQGKENAERRNLSFIERALFAAALVARGFDRKVIGDALAVQKSELSRLLQVADGVPHEVARAIGPAPKAGRERWMAIGTLLERQEARARAQDEIASPRFRAVDSDRRFQLVFNRLSQSDKPEPERPEELKDAAGRVFARLKRDGKAPRIEFLPGTHPAVVQEAVSMLAKWHAALWRIRSLRATQLDRGDAHMGIATVVSDVFIGRLVEIPPNPATARERNASDG